jgi:hypothetical protein
MRYQVYRLLMLHALVWCSLHDNISSVFLISLMMDFNVSRNVAVEL